MNNLNQLTIQNLTLLNWNANGLKQKRSVFAAFLVRHNIDVACVTETHFIQNEPFKLSGYSVYREDRNHPIASGGVAIFIKNNISHHHIFLPALLTIESVGIRIKLQNGQLISVLSVYKSPNRRFHDQDLENLFNLNSPTIVLGDLNCKHCIWGCRTTNPNGARLLQTISNSNIHLSAPNEATHFPWQVNIQPDILDIALHKNFTPPIFQTVLPELDSDHLPVVITFFVQPQFTQPPPRLIDGKVNWEIFHTELDKSLTLPTNLFSINGIDQAVEKFTNSLTVSTQKAIFKKFETKSNSFLHPPIRILHLIKEKHNTRRQWIRYRQPQMKRRLNELTRLVKLELDEYRIKSYQEYVSDIHPSDSNMWKSTKRLLRLPTTIPPLKQDGKVFEDDYNKCNVFADFFETAFSPNPIRDQGIANSVDELLTFPPPSVDRPIKFTSPSEINNIIKLLPEKKAPGHDLIPNVVLKNLTRKALTILTSIMNACISLGYFPSAWRHAEIIVIHKPNKPKDSPSSYRPISLLSTLSKILEKILQKRMFRFIENSQVLPPHQFGFRPKHSTTQQILRLTQTIVQGFENKKHSVAVFLDVAQAFDKVWHDGLLYKLHIYGFPLYIKNIIKSFLSERTFSVKLNSAFSTPRTVKAGVPQGSILGPLLFNIFMSDIPIPEPTTIALYADDTAIITQDLNIEVAIQSLQTSVDTIVHWFHQWRFTLNSNKCETKIFSLRKYVAPPQIHINHINIPWNPDDQAIKYLGVQLDKKLNWNIHVNGKLTQAYSRLTQLFPLINRRSSLKPACTLLVYKTIIRPLITYACPVWGMSISSRKLNRIQILQNKILRIAVNCPWYVRNKHLHEEFGLDNIETFLRKLTKSFLNQLREVPGAVFFNIGQPTRQRRLKSRLPQDVLVQMD